MSKLLHISGNTYPSFNEKEHHTKKIWKELAKGFDEYHIIARSEDNKYKFSQEGNIHLHLVPRITKKSKIFFFSSFWMFYLIKKHQITHLLAQCPIVGGFTSALASKFYKIPLMTEIHGEEYFRFLNKSSLYDRVYSHIMTFSFNSSTKIRSLNVEMSKKLNKHGITKNVVEIPNRVNLDIFNKPKKNYKLSNPLKLISIGRFVKEKDYSKLIENLEKTKINYHLTLIGGGKLKNDYINYINTNNIKEKVRLIDWLDQSEIVELINNSDIYIQSSISEGMPRTIVEAMGLRMPIISTKVGSIEGVLKNMENSILIPSNTSKAWKQSLDLITKDEQFRKQISEKAYADVCDKYEWNNVFQLYRNEIISMQSTY